MLAVLVFAVTLLVAVLLSEIAHRTILSTAVVFLVAGFALGAGWTQVLELRPTDHVVGRFAELALFSILFTDGMRVGLKDLVSAWRLPGRALLLGLPLTLLGTAVLAHFLAGLGWVDALLVGAVLSPTDPVFAAAIVGREEIPWRLRHLLNVESGLNDGLALPVVIVLLAMAAGSEPHLARQLGELGLGVGLGVAIPWVVVRLERTRLLAASREYEPLTAFATGLVVLAVTSLTHANEFLAAFAAGVTIATLAPGIRESFHQFGDLVAELLKLAALLVFGALMSPTVLGAIPASGYLFAVAALVLVRPLALAVALAGAEISRREWLAAAWFGPKGFASVVYGLLILTSGIARSEELFHLIAIVVTLSILLHSSTDVVVAHRFAGVEASTASRSGGLSGDGEGD